MSLSSSSPSSSSSSAYLHFCKSLFFTAAHLHIFVSLSLSLPPSLCLSLSFLSLLLSSLFGATKRNALAFMRVKVSKYNSGIWRFQFVIRKCVPSLKNCRNMATSIDNLQPFRANCMHAKWGIWRFQFVTRSLFARNACQMSKSERILRVQGVNSETSFGDRAWGIVRVRGVHAEPRSRVSSVEKCGGCRHKVELSSKTTVEAQSVTAVAVVENEGGHRPNV